MRVISVVSGKGGVGKTTTVANLGCALAAFEGKRTIAVDANFTTPNLGYHLGVYSPHPTLPDVLAGKAPAGSAVHVHPGGLHVLPGSLPAPGVRLTPENLEGLLDQLQGYEYLLFDCPPGIEAGVEPLLRASDEILTVTNPDLPAVADAIVTLKCAERLGVPTRRIELNRARRERYALPRGEVERLCEAPVALVVPESREVPRSIALGRPAVLSSPHSPPALAFRRLAAEFTGSPFHPPLAGRLAWLLGVRRLRGAPLDPAGWQQKVEPLRRRVAETTRAARRDELERLLAALDTQFEKGFLPEKTYRELRRVNERKLRDLA
ncbi:MAG: AAA family ATPase [Euryarchaeota archaeon]|nr:AAA family ATPase [Euryarchaeota archaeon]